MTAPCISPIPLCWRCGRLRSLQCIENIGWLCKECRDEVAAGKCDE